jgi:hypothetical protein
MAASDATEHSTGSKKPALLLVSPVFSSSSATSSAAFAKPMKNSPYVGWFRHAPPSTTSPKFKPSSWSGLFERTYSSNNDGKNTYIHKVDADFLSKLDRWHQALTVVLLREKEHRFNRTSCFVTKTELPSPISTYDWRPNPPFHEIINGRLVGGSGKDRRNMELTQATTTTALTDPSTTSSAVNVLARLTSWLLFPLVYNEEDDDISLCDKADGLKLVTISGTVGKDVRNPNLSESEHEDSDDDSTSTSSDDTRGDVPERSPGTWPQIDVDTEREFSEMNLSVSEIAEAYHAHRLIDQERQEESRSRSGSRQNQGGLVVTTTCNDDYSVEGSSTYHRLDYEITQMDIARMARNASRHLDVESILNLPTVTYRSKASLPRYQDLGKHHQQSCGAGTRCFQIKENGSSIDDSSIHEDGWSFVMVSGIKSSILRGTAVQHRNKKLATTEEDVCVICLEAFRHGERLRVLPCDHSFHVGCIDRWLSGSHSYNECVTTGCPTCKKRPSDVLTEENTAPKPPPDAMEDDDAEDVEYSLDGSVPSWAFAKLGSAMAMSQGY